MKDKLVLVHGRAKIQIRNVGGKIEMNYIMNYFYYRHNVRIQIWLFPIITNPRCKSHFSLNNYSFIFINWQ